ncbi:FAD/NAD(P)-binding protein [Algoriphagus sp. AGSA1]|uniref:FAD/NAD(P)-binding protein n=1 Tax=Algoriphagus sp. AGSA1 TaxID=2907213 RepID=UPI001F34BB45|nr:FAD/NAD(P)-binding protein [Algoriphagus sp. AGSA1]MCE7054676.1 FAD/NAD(P)-binding protein [Algoriphagus sp. AGSA1]
MSVWTGKFILDVQSGSQGPVENESEIKLLRTDKSINVAIVGGGVIGFFHVLNMIDHYRSDPHYDLDIHWFDKRGCFAEGKEFSVEQPAFKLALCPVGKIDLIQSHWEQTQIKIPAHLGFFKWLNHKLKKRNLEAVPSDWVAKRVLGRYLEEMLLELQEAMPSHVHLYFHRAEVGGVNGENGSIVVKKGFDTKPVNMEFKEVKIGLEPYPLEKLADEKPLIVFAASSRTASYYGNPKRNCDAFKAIRLTDQVLISAVNEYFYDCLFSITEGRGGKFGIKGGKLVYIKSGNEPMSIFPIFPIGLPVLTDSYVKPPPMEFKSLTAGWESVLLEKASKFKINFQQDIYHYLIQEILLLDGMGYLTKSGDILDFYLYNLLEPDTTNHTDFHEMTLENLKNSIEGQPPRHAFFLSEIWRKASTVISRIEKKKGFSDDFYGEFMLKYKERLDWLNLKVPPLYIWKILALAEARIVFFRLGNDTLVTGDLIRGMFRASCYQTKYEKHSNIYINTSGVYNPYVLSDAAIFSISQESFGKDELKPH